jgi:transcriptional regulator with XRE-family HTH domain
MGLGNVLVGGRLLPSLTPGSTTPSIQDAILYGLRPGTDAASGTTVDERQSSSPQVRSYNELMGFKTDDPDHRLWKFTSQGVTQTGEHVGQLLIFPGRGHYPIGKQWDQPSKGSAAPPVAESPQAMAVTWIRQATKLSQKRIGELVGVRRQSVHAWKANSELSTDHLERLLAVKDVLHRAQRNHPKPRELCAWLLGHPGGAKESPASLLARGEIDRARMLAMLSPTPELEPVPAWVGAGTVQRWQEKGEPIDEAYPESEPDLPPAFRGNWIE